MSGTASYLICCTDFLVHLFREALAVVARRLVSGLVPLSDDATESLKTMSENIQARRLRQPGDVGVARTLDQFGRDHHHLDDFLEVRTAVERLMVEMVEEWIWPADDRGVASHEEQL